MEQLGLDRTVRFRMYFDGKGAAAASVMMGSALFLRIAYYLGFGYFDGCGLFRLIFDLILPVLLCGTVAVLIKGFRIGMLRVYGILAAVFCVLMIICTLDAQSIIRSALAVLWYTVTIGIVAATLEGYIGSRIVMQLAFLLPVLYRFFVFDLGDYVLTLELADFLPEASNLCGLIGWSSFARCLMPEQIRSFNAE